MIKYINKYAYHILIIFTIISIICTFAYINISNVSNIIYTFGLMLQPYIIGTCIYYINNIWLKNNKNNRIIKISIPILLIILNLSILRESAKEISIPFKNLIDDIAINIDAVSHISIAILSIIISIIFSTQIIRIIKKDAIGAILKIPSIFIFSTLYILIKIASNIYLNSKGYGGLSDTFIFHIPNIIILINIIIFEYYIISIKSKIINIE